jgi:hypothetical protein
MLAGVNENGLQSNLVSVRESDFEVFEALAVDSVSNGEERQQGSYSISRLSVFVWDKMEGQGHRVGVSVYSKVRVASMRVLAGDTIAVSTGYRPVPERTACPASSSPPGHPQPRGACARE